MGKILVIADREGRGIATPRGLELARRLGHDTEVYAFVYAPLRQLRVNDDEKAAIKKRLLAEREEELQARIERHSKGGQKVKLKVLWSKDVANTVVKQCARSDYVMVVKTGRRSDTLVHTSTDWQLLRACPAPVLIVAAKKWRRTSPVLAAVDLASQAPAKQRLNEAILGQAKALAEAMDEELKIVCAVEVPALLNDLDLVDPYSYLEEAKADMQPHLRALAAKLDIPEKMFKVKRGPVEKVICSEAASRRAQIVVMGSVGRKGLKAALIGNTAENVLTHLKTDVLALKP